jgi:hypothetical protein
MILEEAPESAKQLCTLKLKISNVRRKGGTWDLECEPILAAFIVDLISTLFSSFASTILEMLLLQQWSSFEGHWN